jgi:uncharacterized protein (TIGR02679 family)
MDTGSITVTISARGAEDSHPLSSEAGDFILGPGHLVGDKVEVNLDTLAEKVVPNSPFSVAWHCVQSHKAAHHERVRLTREARSARLVRIAGIRERIIEQFGLSEVQGREMVLHNWDNRVEVESPKFLDDALALYRALPGPGGELVDRRRLGQEVLGNPHALDSRRPLASFILDLLIVTGVATSRMRPREAWRAAGVLGDGVHEGMAIIGVAPVGMALKDGMVVVLPPRTLEMASWPAPELGGEDVFVTENPSILEAAAAAGIAGLQMVCTLGAVSGSPGSEIKAALVAMGESGYRLHVRGDFDAFGLEHTNNLLRSVPGSVPWRMGTSDYLDATASGIGSPLSSKFPLDAIWDKDLVVVMEERGLIGNEEALLDGLLEDLEWAFCPGKALAAAL